uniref:At2g35280-like TPR domain-containing protein n=1 Tax=Lactuca sativa TaxID=4236 RepID=A0A9R1VGW1_LACSA|nr:hypothetical protein LSAT_V11C500289820 [Lactuca sativa]
MSNVRCCSSLDDLPAEILTRIIVMLGSESAKDIISTIICSKKMYAAGEEIDVFKEVSLHMFEGMSPKDLKVDLFIHKYASYKNSYPMYRQGVEECFFKGNFDLGMSLLYDEGDKDHLETIYLLGMICISRGPHGCDEGMYSTYITLSI